MCWTISWPGARFCMDKQLRLANKENIYTLEIRDIFFWDTPSILKTNTVLIFVFVAVVYFMCLNPDSLTAMLSTFSQLFHPSVTSSETGGSKNIPLV